jgi:ABC-type nitrate/sulfonate/bicarbonate transport system substrate-binding protein
MWVAKEAGIFKRNGLDVELIREQAATSVMALLSCELNVIHGAAAAVVQSNVRDFGSLSVPYMNVLGVNLRDMVESSLSRASALG